MIPAIFKDSELWFKLYVATLKANGVDALTTSGGHVAQIECAVDSETYQLEYHTWQSSSKIYMAVAIMIAKHHVTSFQIAYGRRYWKDISSRGKRPLLAETEKYRTHKYASRRLPHMKDAAFIAHMEHVIMMFKLAGERVA